MSGIERYGAKSQRFAGPGGSDWDVWLLMFEDQDRGSMVFGGKDYPPGEAERLAWEAWNRVSPTWNCHLFRLAELRPDPDQSERERRLEEALKDLVAFVSVMCGSGEEAVIPETVATPLGVQVKIGAMMRDARSALNQEGGSNVG